MNSQNRTASLTAKISTMLLVVAVLITACGQAAPQGGTSAGGGQEGASKPDHVIFALDWVIYGRHTPYFVALDKGYFSDNNIEATVLRGFGSVDSVKRLASGQADFVFADLGALILAKANQDVQAKMFLMGYGGGGHAVMFLKDSGIQTPQDLVGKTVAGAPGASVTALFPGFLAANGIDPADVNMLSVDASTLNPLLLSGKADAMLEFAFNKVQLDKTGADQGLVSDYFLYTAYNFPIYANGMITTDATIQNNPDLVRRFADAIIKGYQYTFDHPTEACTIMRKYNPDIDQDVCEGEVAITTQLVMTDEAKQNGIGYMDAKRVQSTIDVMKQYLGLTGDVAPQDVFTNDFLPTQQ